MRSSESSLMVGARASPLSLRQVEELFAALRPYCPELSYVLLPLLSEGDKDKGRSLRTLPGRTDFFTKEIDQALLAGRCRVAVHSAKDLPHPLPAGLAIIAVTRGLDSSDALALAPGRTISSLSPGAKIATSSERREAAVTSLRSGLSFVDIRGTIGERLAALERGEVDGVVVAEAALIRLGLTHLNRCKLPGEAAPLQGQLAVVAREDDKEMAALFAPLDTGDRPE